MHICLEPGLRSADAINGVVNGLDDEGVGMLGPRIHALDPADLAFKDFHAALSVWLARSCVAQAQLSNPIKTIKTQRTQKWYFFELRRANLTLSMIVFPNHVRVRYQLFFLGKPLAGQSGLQQEMHDEIEAIHPFALGFRRSQ